MMRFKEELKQFLKGKMPESKLRLLPSGFQMIGDIIIISMKPGFNDFEKDIGKAVMDAFPSVKTVCAKTGGVRGELRKPMIKKLAGDGTATTHAENGCRYRLDVTKVMFAKGNSCERGRIPALVKDGEVIIDMFAGIGYFTIPIAVHAMPKTIYAIEKNPDSVRFLRENIKLNGVSRVEVVEGDNREAIIPERADRVIMGYLPGTEEFLPRAFGILKDAGTIHFHNTYRKEELWERPLKELENAANAAGFRLEKITHKRVVKHFSPGVEHVVIDAEFRAH